MDAMGFQILKIIITLFITVCSILATVVLVILDLRDKRINLLTGILIMLASLGLSPFVLILYLIFRPQQNSLKQLQ